MAPRLSLDGLSLQDHRRLLELLGAPHEAIFRELAARPDACPSGSLVPSTELWDDDAPGVFDLVFDNAIAGAGIPAEVPENLRDLVAEFLEWRGAQPVWGDYHTYHRQQERLAALQQQLTEVQAQLAYHMQHWPAPLVHTAPTRTELGLPKTPQTSRARQHELVFAALVLGFCVLVGGPGMLLPGVLGLVVLVVLVVVWLLEARSTP